MELFGVDDQIGGVDRYAAAVWRDGVVVAQGLLQSCRQSMRLTVKGKAQDGRAVGETRGLVGLVGLLQTPPLAWAVCSCCATTDHLLFATRHAISTTHSH